MTETGPRRGRKGRLIGLGALLLLVILAVLAYSRFLHARNHLILARAHMENAQRLLENKDAPLLQPGYLVAIGEEFKKARQELSAAAGKAWPVSWAGGWLGWVPSIGGDLRAIPHLLAAASGISEIGALSTEGLYPLAELSATNSIQILTQEGSPAEVIAALQKGQPAFQRAARQLDQVVRERRALREADLSPALARQVARIDSILPLLQSAVRAGALAPELAISLLGLDGPKSYLIVAQNSDELRATGGFIGGVWLLKLNGGRIESLDFQDSTLVDDPTRQYGPPPPGLFKYLNAGVWLFRDANWDPDFPTSAKQIERFYEYGQHIKVDGVIAVDQAGLQMLLAAVGPVFLSQFSEWVSGDNVVSKVKDYYSASNQGQAAVNPILLDTSLIPGRKRFMKELLEALVTKLQSGADNARMAQLLRGAKSAFAEKHLFFYSHDERIAGLLRQNGWDGSLAPTTSDYLAVIDSNVGFDKISSQIAETVEYQVAVPDKGRAKARVTVTYRNTTRSTVLECVQQSRHAPAYPQYQEGCYWDYMRVYAPKDSRLTDATYFPLPPGSLMARIAHSDDPNRPTVELGHGKQVFGNFFSLAPGETKQVTFEYELPSSVTSGDKTYDLLIQKQAGTIAIPIKVVVSLPKGAKLASVSPSPSSVSGSQVTFQTELRVDREFTVRFSR
ncbi:MAG: DUF4012 domain-containing protein [Chloroflexi bacterium]|nr:DUF4012 domain-containing protein [Chloroflexota bacterium]